MKAYHVKPGEKYHTANSLRGIHKAKRLGYSAIDLDMSITKDRRIVGNHWPRPMVHDGFRDPLRRIKRTTLIRNLTMKQVRRLVAGVGYRIQPIERLLAECAKVGIQAVLDPKDPRFRLDWPWEHIAQVADDLGADIRMYAERDRPYEGFGKQAVAAAARHGIPGKVI